MHTIDNNEDGSGTAAIEKLLEALRLIIPLGGPAIKLASWFPFMNPLASLMLGSKSDT